MGVLSHSKQWQFSVAATPGECAQVFRQVMSASPGLRVRAVKWGLEESSVRVNESANSMDALVSTYLRRAGFAAFSTGLFGERAEAAQERASGQIITFAYGAETANRSTCIMWLSKSSKTLGLTADAGFIRSYMSSVEKGLRGLDSGLAIQRG